jgi:hypothetical protein
MLSRDYPRMLFHRTKEPVTVQSRAEEDALGPGWSRIIWPVSAIAAPEPAPEPEPEPEPQAVGYAAEEPEPGGPAHQVEALRRAVRAREEPAPAAPTRPARAPIKPPARSKRKG